MTYIPPLLPRPHTSKTKQAPTKLCSICGKQLKDSDINFLSGIGYICESCSTKIRYSPTEPIPDPCAAGLASEARADAAVVHPSHYNATKYETWDVLDEWFSTDPLLWQAGKYLSRAGKKGPIVEDLEKAIQYIQRRINKEKEKNGKN